jgi:predicted thioesterase
VDLRKAVTAGSVLYVVADVQEVDGRKVKLKGTVLDAPDGAVLLEASALFVTARSSEH